MSNPQLIKEPYFLLAYAETHALKERDLKELHGEPAAIVRGIRTNLLHVYTTEAHPANGWLETVVDNLVSLYTQILRIFVLVAPLDDSGRSLPLEAADISRMISNTRELRQLARKSVQKLDVDFTLKNSGRAAAGVVSGARSLNTKLFSAEDAWIYKKAAGKASGADGGRWDANGRGGRGGGGRGRGDRGGRGGGRGGKREREENKDEEDG